MALRGNGAKTALLVVCMLVLGSYNTLNTKLQFQSCAHTTDPAAFRPDGHKGCPVGQAKFNKPWLTNMYMFLGEASLLIVYRLTRRPASAREQPAAAAGEHLIHEAVRPAPFYIFAVPAFCDVFGTGLAAVGMQYMDSAVWQMLRSSIIIFSALLSVCFLGRRLQPFHWVATAVVFVGLLLVGLASLLDGGGRSTGVTASQRLVGMLLVIGAQLCAAFQMVFEEKLLTGRAKTSAKKVVGMEGMWGGLFMVIILTVMSTLPGQDAGHYESSPDGLHMVGHSPMLLVLVPTYMLSIAGYNFTGILVGKRMSAVVRCLVDSCRTFVVWGANLFIYYFISKDFGAGWGAHSWLTLLGFLVLVFGTLLYNEVLPVPKFLAGVQEDPLVEGSFVSRTNTGIDPVLIKVDLTDEAEAAAGLPAECRAAA